MTQVTAKQLYASDAVVATGESVKVQVHCAFVNKREYKVEQESGIDSPLLFYQYFPYPPLCYHMCV